MSLMCILLRGPIEIKFPGEAIRKFWICINNKIVSAFFYVNCLKLEEGIKKTTEWFLNNKEILDKRYNAFVDH